MTDIAFHFNVPDRVTYACRFLRKAVNNGAKVWVTGSSVALRELDEALWTFSTVDFVPHCREDSEELVRAASPVVLAASTLGAPHQQVLLNLGLTVPDGFDRFERLVEIVGTDDADRQSARARWRQYTQGGHAITRHDLALNKLSS